MFPGACGTALFSSLKFGLTPSRALASFFLLLTTHVVMCKTEKGDDPHGSLLHEDKSCQCSICTLHILHKSIAEAGLIESPNEVPAHTPRQGKVAELRQELTNTGKKDKNHTAKKNALKKIVANMTMSNNDMIALFPDIVACMQIPMLEIKKMYLRSTTGLYSEQADSRQVFPLSSTLCSHEA